MPDLPKVLYVDDEEINLELLQLTLRNDLKVYTAITAEEGFNKELIFRYLMKPWNKDELYQTILEAYQR